MSKVTPRKFLGSQKLIYKNDEVILELPQEIIDEWGLEGEDSVQLQTEEGQNEVILVLSKTE